jgi:NADH dehydrogenase
MTLSNVLILGGSGFVGTAIANRLADLGVKVTVPSRRRERQRSLILLPNVDMVEADIHDPATLTQLMRGKDAVINLVGILHSRDIALPYSADFVKAHIELPAKVVAACRETGVRRLLQMSALNADADAPSEYLRSKAAGEAVVLDAKSDLDITIFRPSVVFGPGDSFLAMFARMMNLFPFFPLGYGQAKFQPIYVGDVASAFVRSLEERSAFGQVYELAGPKVYSLSELANYVNDLCGKPSRVVAISDFWAHLQAGLMWLAPKPMMSPDNLRSMLVDSVMTGEAKLPFGLVATSLEAVAPTYVAGKAPRVHYDQFRVKAGR